MMQRMNRKICCVADTQPSKAIGDSELFTRLEAQEDKTALARSERPLEAWAHPWTALRQIFSRFLRVVSFDCPSHSFMLSNQISTK
jgi:hypothetical protein